MKYKSPKEISIPDKCGKILLNIRKKKTKTFDRLYESRNILPKSCFVFSFFALHPLEYKEGPLNINIQRSFPRLQSFRREAIKMQILLPRCEGATRLRNERK